MVGRHARSLQYGPSPGDICLFRNASYMSTRTMLEDFAFRTDPAFAKTAVVDC